MKAVHWIRFAALLVFAAMSSSVQAQANPPATPTVVKGFAIVSPEQARALLGRAAFFDMRSAVNYGKGHIEGAKALPYDQKSALAADFDAALDRFDMAKLPADKNAAIVFYSDGQTGWKSYKAAVIASRAGYKNVKWLREGTAGWLARGYELN